MEKSPSDSKKGIMELKNNNEEMKIVIAEEAIIEREGKKSVDLG